jgi:hypothetical protein
VFPARASEPGCALCTGPGAGACALAARIELPARRTGWRQPWTIRQPWLSIARTVRGLLIAAPVLALTGLIGGDYVGATDAISLVYPFLAGLACGAALSRGAAPERGWHIVGLGMALGGIESLLGFWSANEPYGPTGRWLPPVIFGAIGPIAWWFYDLPPKKKKQPVS